MTLTQVRQHVSQTLSPERAQHVLAVEELLLNLAARVGVDAGEASLAALGHDLARELSDSQLLQLAQEHQLELLPWHQQTPMLAHGLLAAPLLRKQGCTVSREVEEAMRSHTLGEERMGLLAQLLFCADYLEPNRPYLDPDRRRRWLALAPVEIFSKVVASRCAYQRRQAPLLPPTQRLMDWLCK